MTSRLLILLFLLAALAPISDAVSVHTLQATIGAATTEVSSTDIYCRQAIFQNNAAHVMRVGDSNTSSSRGALLNAASGGSAGGSMNVGPLVQRSINLAEYYVNGTQNEVLDVVYLD